METDRNEIDRTREEIVRTHKDAYERMYRHRMGKEPPNRSLPRVLLIRDEPPPEGEEPPIGAILFAGGAAAADWDAGEAAADAPFDALLVAASAIDDPERLDRFRRFLRRTIGRSSLIAGLGPGVALLAREGFLGGRRASGAPEEKELLAAHDVVWTDAAVVRDGPFLTCRDGERAGDLVDELMEMILSTEEEKP